MSDTSTSRSFGRDRKRPSAGTNRATSDTTVGDRELTAGLFVRSLAPAGAREQQGAVLERLDRLVESDRLSDYTVTVWGSGICPASAVGDTEAGRATLETIAEFEQWAGAEDLCFRAGFTRRTAGSIAGEEATTVIEFPTMCLAIREAGTLRCVAPCSGVDTGVEHSIADCLDDLGGDETSDHGWA